jgi:hypothetical protein
MSGSTPHRNIAAPLVPRLLGGALFLVWLGLSVVGFLGRLKYRLGVAFRLMRGQPVENVWQVF